MKESIIQKKSFNFSVRIIEAYKTLINQKKEYSLARQLVKSGTSIGANVEEALGGQSKKDFISKISIAYKEARETHYWIRLFIKTSMINKEEGFVLLEGCNEILRIISAIQRTAKQNL